MALIIVAAGRALEGREGLAAVGRLVGRRVGDVDDVRILGIDCARRCSPPRPMTRASVLTSVQLSPASSER